MGSKRAEAAAATKEKVVRCAHHLFTAYGYERVTMRQIAGMADLSTGAIFAHFKDKDALFEAAMERTPPMGRLKTLLNDVITSGQSDALAAAWVSRDLFGREP